MNAVLEGFLHQVGKDRKPRVDCRVEALLLDGDHFADIVVLFTQLRVAGFALLHDDFEQLAEEGMIDAEQLAVAGGAADDAAQYVAASLVGGNHAIRDHKGRGADMVGDDANRDIVSLVRAVGLARNGTDGIKNPADRVHLEHVVHTLHHAGQTLEPHAGIDIFMFQFLIGAVAHIIELGEDVVPNLHIAVAVAARPAVGGAAAVFFTAVKIDFRAGAAGTGAVLPEVILLAEADNAFLRYADDVAPDGIGFVVLLVDGGPELFFRNFERLRQKFPSPRNGVAFEVIAEGEIAQHLEKRAVARGVSDAVKVGGTDAFLAGGDTAAGRLLFSGEEFFHRRHAGVDDQKRFVVVRHERKARQAQVSL